MRRGAPVTQDFTEIEPSTKKRKLEMDTKPDDYFDRYSRQVRQILHLSNSEIL